MTGGSPALPRDSSLDHILLDYPVSNEETISRRYHFFYDLGSGAYATVKYGTCSQSNEAFAVKIISKTKTPKDYLKKFVPREVDALKRLAIHQHPYICQMREFFETPQRVYLVTKLAVGGDLLTYINSRKYLNEETSRKMICELLCALDHIHELGIVHRDLKCENLLIGPEDGIIVTDFGFATQQPKNRLLTTFCGSYAYAAPEILTGSSYNGKCTDVWSVGIILYAMLNGKLPFNDTKPKNILAKIKTTPLVIVRRVSVACEKFVRSILTISSMERPSIGDLLIKRWLESPLQKILKVLPAKLHPSCLKLALPSKRSFRMSDSSEECLKIFSPRDIGATSPQLPLKIANEFIAHNSSHKTSSTISERMKKKYRQIKDDLKTWASRKRKGVANAQFVDFDFEEDKTKDRPATGKLLKISRPSSKTAILQEHHMARLKYTVRESNQTSSKKVLELDITTRDKDGRSVSAVPPDTRRAQRRRPSLEARAKSCKPEQSHGTGYNTSSSKNTRRSSDSSSFGASTRRKAVKEPRRGSGTESGINEQILQYLTQQRENSAYKHAQKTTKLGLPPLNRDRTRTSGDKSKSKRKSSLPNSVKESRASKEKSKRRASYETAMLYHNIQNISNKLAEPSANRTNPVTPTKVVAVNPKPRRASYESRRGGMENKTLAGIHELSTVYTH